MIGLEAVSYTAGERRAQNTRRERSLSDATPVRKFLLLPPLFTPLVFYSLSVYEPYEFQLFYFVFAVLLALLGYLPYVWRRNYASSFSPVDILVLLFLLVSVISVLANGNDLLNQQGLKLLSALIVFYFVTKSLISANGSGASESVSRFVLWSALCVAFIEAGIGILQNYSIELVRHLGYFKVIGTFYNPNQYAAFISPFVPIGLALYLSEKKLFLKRSALFMVSTIVFILPVTLTRSSWLGAIVGTGLFALLRQRKRLIDYFVLRKLRLLLAYVSLVVLLVVMVFVLYRLKPSSAEARLLIWRVTKEMITDKPALGIGYGNYGARYMDYQARFFEKPENVRSYSMVAGNVKYADNDFVQIFAELGIVGSMIFLVLLGVVYIMSYRRLRFGELSERAEHYLIGAMGSMGAFVVVSFFGFPLHITPTALIFFLMLAVITALAATEVRRPQAVFLNRTMAIVFVTIMILVVYDIPQKICAYRIWDEAFGLSARGDYKHALEKYKSVHDRLNGNGKFHFMLGATYATFGMYREAIEELERSKRNYNDPKIYLALGVAHEKLGNYSEAEKNYLKASRMMPHWMYPHYLMAKICYRQCDFAKARTEAERVVEMPIKVESEAIYEMKDEMRDMLWKIRQREEAGLERFH